MFELDNKTARRLWLHRQGLLLAPTGPLSVPDIVRSLGYVQLDTINIITRAHHHILWSRNQNYRQHHLARCLNPGRSLFEHFTHDASVLPMEFLPYWQRQFDRHRQKFEKSSWFSNMSDADGRAEIRERIRREGALSTYDFESAPPRGDHAWARPPHKQALDYMWHCGELATCHRRGFTKMYDLAERIYPQNLRDADYSDAERVDWLNRQALKRLGFATTGEMQRFWDAMTAREAKAWAETGQPGLEQIRVEAADGTWSDAWALSETIEAAGNLPAPSDRLRLLNPFDPVVRDRARASRLFGFDYRIEIFVPIAKRRWGYYIYPLLEGTRFVGRIEARTNQKQDCLEVTKLWKEPGVRWGAGRAARLEAELIRIARLAGVKNVAWCCRRQPDEGPG